MWGRWNYLFNKKVLSTFSNSTISTNFGKQIIPAANEGLQRLRLSVRRLLEDIEPSARFSRGNIAMTSAAPPFNFYDEAHPIFTNARFLPAAKISGSKHRFVNCREAA